MLDVKQEEIIRSLENRIRFENLYDTWIVESPQAENNQVKASKPLQFRLEVPAELRKEMQRLRDIRDRIRNIAC